MDNNQYALIAGAILTLVAFWFPGVKGWYEKLSSAEKQLVMLVAIFVAVAGRFGLSCIGKDTAFACSWDGAYDAISTFVLALVSSAGVYKGVNYLAKR